MDALFDKDNSLDASPIPWKPIGEIVNDVPQHHEVMNIYEGKSHVVSKTDFMTKFDLDYENKKKNNTPMEMSREEIRKHSMFDSDIQQATSSFYTLFGDLKKIIEYKKYPSVSVKCTYYYPFGRNEVLLDNPSECRKRAEGELKDKKACGEWIEYYNNGVVRYKGVKENGEWVSKESFLNNGKTLVE